MSRVFVEDTEMTAIADAIRAANGSTDKYLPSEMPRAIKSCVGGDISKFGLSNEVTGTGIVTCDYVNENEHNVEVKLSSDTVTDFSGVGVKCVSNNFLRLTNREIKTTIDTNFTGNNMYLGIAASNNINSDKITSYSIDESSLTMVSTENGYGIGLDVSVEENEKYIVSSDSSEPIYTAFYNSEGGFLLFSAKKAFTTPAGAKWAVVVFRPTQKVEHTYSDIQLELGTVETNYKPCTEKTYTANADGTVDGVTSISPVMNIICDTEGVDISAKYYQCPSVEYDRFWDEYQENGMRTIYSNAFANQYWNDKTFSPKYDLVITSSANGELNMFTDAQITDIKGILERNGVTLDTSNSPLLNCTFLRARLNKRLPTLNVQNVSRMINSFNTCILLEELGLADIQSNCTFENAFNSCSYLKYLTVSGVIGKTIDLQWSSLLELESAKNILRCLANLVDTNPFTQTITFHVDVWSKLAEEGNTSPNGNTWEEYLTDIGWNKG